MEESDPCEAAARWTWSLRLTAGSLGASEVVIDRFSRLIGCECVRRAVRPNPEYIPPHEAHLYDDVDEDDLNDPTRFCADLEYRLPPGKWSELVYSCLMKASRAGRGGWELEGNLERWFQSQCHVIKDSGIHHALWVLERGSVQKP